MPDQSGSGTTGHRGAASMLNGGELIGQVEEGMEDLRERAAQVADRAAGVVRENPLFALAGAAAIGFIFARLISRR